MQLKNLKDKIVKANEDITSGMNKILKVAFYLQDYMEKKKKTRFIFNLYQRLYYTSERLEKIVDKLNNILIKLDEKEKK